MKDVLRWVMNEDAHFNLMEADKALAKLEREGVITYSPNPVKHEEAEPKAKKSKKKETVTA